MTPEEAEAIRARACGQDKKRYSNGAVAQEVADDRNAALGWKRGDAGWISKYRCPFCGWWHLGHALSVEGMTHMATAIRVLAGDGPGADAGTVSKRERRRRRRSA